MVHREVVPHCHHFLHRFRGRCDGICHDIIPQHRIIPPCILEMGGGLFGLQKRDIGHVQHLDWGRVVQDHAFLREVCALSFRIYNKFEALVRVYASGLAAARQLLLKLDLTGRRVLLVLLLILILLVLGKEYTGGEAILETRRLLF